MRSRADSLKAHALLAQGGGLAAWSCRRAGFPITSAQLRRLEDWRDGVEGLGGASWADGLWVWSLHWCFV